MPEDFISDDDMARLGDSPDFITDDDMSAIPDDNELGVIPAALAGLSQGLTLGYGDEIIGAGQAAIGKLTGEEGDYDELYKKYRDERRGLYKRARELNPVTFGASEFAGGIAPAFITGGAAAPATVKGAIGYGALGGGAAGLGYSEAEDLSGMAKDTARGAAIGGALSGATTAAVKGAGKLFGGGKPTSELVREYIEAKNQGFADSLQDFAEVRAAKAAVGNQAKYMDPLIRKGKVNKFGRDLLDENIVGFGDKAENILEKAAQAKDKIWGSMDELIEGVEAPVSGQGIGDDLLNYATEIDAPNTQGTVNQVLNQAKDFQGRGDVSMREAQRWKNLYKWDDRDPSTMALGKEATNKAKMIISNQMENAVEKSGADELLSKYRDLKSKYGSAALAEEVAEKLTSRQAKNRTFSLTDYGSAAAGVVSQGPRGAAFGLANKVLRERGSSAVAVGADKLSQTLRRNPTKFGKYSETLIKAVEKGPTSVGATHYILWKNDPEYRETVERGLAEGLDSL